MSRRAAAPLLPLLALALLAPPAAADSPDRSRPPQPGPVRPLRLPPEQRLALSNGIGVHLLSHHEVPVAEVVLLVRVGATADPAGRDGVATMTSAMLDEGAASRDALALADELDFLGAELGCQAGWDHSTVRLRVPVSRLEKGLALLSDVALRPDFPEKELQRLRKEALTRLLQARDAPGQVASRALQQAVFGLSHRYGRPLGGDAAALSALSVADLRAFHEAHYRPEAATLVVVGDVDASVLPLLEKAFGAWARGSGAPPARIPAPPQLRSRTVWLVDKPGAVQSSLRFGRVGPAATDPGLHAAEVMNTLLGGSFTSRLNDNLRERHGFTYGARSVLDRRRVGGLFLAVTDVQGQSTAEAVSEVVKELRRIRTPAPAEEVDRARNYLALGYAGELETTRQLAAQMVERIAQDLPADHFEQFAPKVLAVDAAALRQAAEAVVDPGRLAVVVVGDRKAVEAPLRALGLGEMRLLTVEDVMGPLPKVE